PTVQMPLAAHPESAFVGERGVSQSVNTRLASEESPDIDVGFARSVNHVTLAVMTIRSCRTVQLSNTHTHTHTHTLLSPHNTHTHTHTHTLISQTHTHTLSSLKHTHTHLSNTHTHLSNTHTHLSNTHTHTHTLTHSLTH